MQPSIILTCLSLLSSVAIVVVLLLFLKELRKHSKALDESIQKEKDKSIEIAIKKFCLEVDEVTKPPKISPDPPLHRIVSLDGRSKKVDRVFNCSDCPTKKGVNCNKSNCTYKNNN